MLSIDKISQVLTGHNILAGYNDANYGTTLEKIHFGLNEVARQHIELETMNTQGISTVTTIAEQSSIARIPLATLSPNHNSNDLLATKLLAFLRSHGIETRFTPQFDSMVKSLSKHDLAALSKLYNVPTISEAIDLIMPSIFDTVVLVDDGNRMSPDYIRKSKEIIANIMFASMLYDGCGVYIRSVNTNEGADEIKVTAGIDEYFSKLHPVSSSKSLGAEIYEKIYEYVVEPSVDTSTKPVLSVVLLGSVPTNPDEVVDSLQQCKEKSKGIMFTVFVNVSGSHDVSTYLRTLTNNTDVLVLDNLQNGGQLVMKK